jgi:polyhydroxybutyrate depolymerase
VTGMRMKSTRIRLLTLLGALWGCSDEVSFPNPGAGGSNSAGASGSGSNAGSTAGPSALAGASGSITPTAGTGAGAAGTGGMSGGGGAGGFGGASVAGSAGNGGGAGGSPAVRSTGCGMAAAQPLATWSERPKLPVNGKDRQWWVWLPNDYDPMRAYPVIFTFHGCGGASNFIPMQTETGDDAIVIRGTGADNGCWTYGGEGEDVMFFDAMLATIGAQYCADTSRVFAMGYSSGGWMTNTLECTRGDKLRATGTLSGGRAGNGMGCKGKFARATVHDLNDPTNPFDKQGAAQELDRVLAQNHCMTALPPVMEDPAPCARYQGCDAGYPVIACRTEGKGHDRQDALAMDVFWKLFSSL